MNVDDLYGEETLRVVDAFLEGRATDEQSAEVERLMATDTTFHKYVERRRKQPNPLAVIVDALEAVEEYERIANEPTTRKTEPLPPRVREALESKRQEK